MKTIQLVLVASLLVGLSVVAYADASLTPFDVAFYAYRGYFKSEGITSYGELCSNIKSQNTTGEEIVSAALANGRLTLDYDDDFDSFGYDVKNILLGICS